MIRRIARRHAETRNDHVQLEASGTLRSQTARAMRFDRSIAPREQKCHTCGTRVAMTNEQMIALEAVRTAFIAAERIGLTEAEICKAAITGLVNPGVKSGRPPGNYNPMPGDLGRPKYKAQHE